MTMAAERYTGASVKRSEDPRILTGRGRYVDDVKLPGMLHAAFVRSPFAHARLVSVDVSAARGLPGVVAVFTGEDIEAMVVPGPDAWQTLMGRTTRVPEFTVLVTDKARFVGDPVAVVVAESRAIAEDACELVDVEYDPLPPVPDAAAALDPASVPLFANLGSNITTHRANQHGDVPGVFERADRVLEFHLDVHRHQNVPMETRGCVVSYDAQADALTMYSATQSTRVTRLALANRLGMAEDRVRVLAGDVGGSFGLKIGASREEQAVAASARALRRPVKWTEDRGENLAASGQAREESADIRVAVTDDGDVLGLDVTMVIDTGSYPGAGSTISAAIEALLPGPYKMAALGFESTAVTTNKARYIAYRGPWATETFIRERVLDLVAKTLGLDPLEVRLRNVAPRTDPPATMITSGRPLAGVTTKESLERLAEMADIPAFRQRQAAERSRGRYLGLGVGTFLEAAPGPRIPGGRPGPLGREHVRLRLDEDGTVLVFTGQMPHGQSHQTTLAQIAADEFGVPFEQVRVVVGDSDAAPFGLTGGSRSATMAGGVTLHGARDLKAKVLNFASHLMEASAADLQISDGNIFVRGDPDSAITVRDVARQAASGGFGADVDTDLEVEGVYDGGEGGWSVGSHCAIVEVDIETGLVKVERYLAAEDCGVLINPAVVEGQIRGAVAQGIGAVLLERSAYDENANFQAATFMDYLLPTACDIPRIEISHLETVPLDADVNFRGVGEGGMLVAPATIVSAIEDALAPFGIRIYEQHLPPARILELISAATAGSGSAIV